VIGLLHVVGADFDPSAGEALRCAVTRLDALGYRQRVVSLSTSVAARLGRVLESPVDSIGLSADSTPTLSRLAARFPAPWLRAPGLRRRVPDGDRRLLHAWGVQPLVACRTLSDVPCVASLTRPPHDMRRLHSAVSSLAGTNSSSVSLIVGNAAARRRLAQRGVDPQRVAVVRPPVDFRAINEARGKDLRQALPGAETGPIILATGPAERIDHQFDAAWSVAIVQQAYPGARIMLPFASVERARIHRFLRPNKLERMIAVPPPTWGWAQLVSAADVLIDACPHDTRSAPLAWAMAANVPVVAVATYSAAELIADRHNGMLSKTGQPFMLAAVTMRLLDEHDLRRTITDTARGQAYEVFSQRAFTDNLHRVYQNVLEDRLPADAVEDTAMVS
jgi:glycosyltransferase involved in cell wall biosynthesis